MTSPHARYTPGRWTALAAPHRWLLVELETRHSAIEPLWSALSDGQTPEDVLDVLIAGGVRTTPAFALLWLDDAARAILRGPSSLELRNEEEVSTHTATQGAFWVQYDLGPTASEFRLASSEPADTLQLPMASGITLASAIGIQMRPQDPESPAAHASTPPSRSAEPSTTATHPNRSYEPWRTTPSSEPNDDSISAHNDSQQVNAVPTDPTNPSSTDQSAPDEESAPTYDHLFGATVRPIRSAQPATDPPSTERASTPPPAEVTATWNATSGVAAEPPRDAPTPASSSTSPDREASEQPGQPAFELIDAVPWQMNGHQATTESPAPSPRFEGPPTAGDHPTQQAAASNVQDGADGPDDDGTVSRAALLAGAAHDAGPTVLAVRCPSGHLTPHHSAVCRVCRSPIETQKPFECIRPALGRLRLSTGDTVTVDRGILIGRKPTAPQNCLILPNLVRVNSPEHDVSRQHAEIVTEGWQVYVRDLGSTNGTTVTLPGQQPQRLREAELQLLEDGAVIVLADEIQCVFEVTA